ncbi:hypothetical protein [Tengunoibacter tsumagoiensis]|uniref:Topology modulation protein n=1 Tax=Tengunoibacter tsumagoiensis TaxID=2014871 RepID=A0A402A6N7_9CHLR|nr:hypothetical protein [Tengunoibacter tsumagoiensis]GCE14807.1 hypothetical protein KTT_46660 [Tengunoibacter tsumagoiensis]
MVKIHIIGGSGSGKTTLAQRLSSTLQIPHYDLDKVNWKQENEVDIAEQPDWITEGIYLIFTEAMLYHADHIIVLSAPWPVLAQRIIRRHLLNSLRGTQAYPGLNGIKALIKLIKDTRRYCLNQYEQEIPSIQHLLEYIEAHQGTVPSREFVKMYVEAYGNLVAPPTSQFVTEYLARYKEKVIFINNRTDLKRFEAHYLNK